jgi:hypothetical protein
MTIKIQIMRQNTCIDQDQNMPYSQLKEQLETKNLTAGLPSIALSTLKCAKKVEID